MTPRRKRHIAPDVEARDVEAPDVETSPRPGNRQRRDARPVQAQTARRDANLDDYERELDRLDAAARADTER